MERASRRPPPPKVRPPRPPGEPPGEGSGGRAPPPGARVGAGGRAQAFRGGPEREASLLPAAPQCAPRNPLPPRGRREKASPAVRSSGLSELLHCVGPLGYRSCVSKRQPAKRARWGRAGAPRAPAPAFPARSGRAAQPGRRGALPALPPRPGGRRGLGASAPASSRRGARTEHFEPSRPFPGSRPIPFPRGNHCRLHCWLEAATEQSCCALEAV